MPAPSFCQNRLGSVSVVSGGDWKGVVKSAASAGL